MYNIKTFNLQTYKLHVLGNYMEMVIWHHGLVLNPASKLFLKLVFISLITH